MHCRLSTVSTVLVAVIALDACSTAPTRNPDVRPAAEAGPTVAIYVVKRSWHIDIGFSANDLHPPLTSLRTALPGTRYLLFGFGDRHYLLTHGRSIDRLSGALWPGPGLVLLTGLEATPEEAFEKSGVIRLRVTTAQARELEEFVWKTLDTQNGAATVLAPGPYSGSLYYGSVERYSAFYTCNTWAAEALQAVGLPVHSFGVEFSGQLWRQVRGMKRREETAASIGGDAPQPSASHP
ncbi:MAG: DUF2459 domain-containing protein [Steroidobacteraceae bacterium]